MENGTIGPIAESRYMEAAETSEVSIVLERYRPYLHFLARMQMGGMIREKLEPSDIVQQTLLLACKEPEAVRGRSEGEVMAWLRKILVNSILGTARDLGRAKRNPRLERSLQAALDASSCQLENWLAAEAPSPSRVAERHESLLRLTAALQNLPENQRDVLVMRHCQNMSLADIAARMELSQPSVAGLLHRGLAKLRSVLRDHELD